jgi:hypothetical protein
MWRGAAQVQPNNKWWVCVPNAEQVLRVHYDIETTTMAHIYIYTEKLQDYYYHMGNHKQTKSNASIRTSCINNFKFLKRCLECHDATHF